MQQDPHRIRLEANRELHARPFPVLNATSRLVHLCVRVSPTSRDEVRAWLREKIKDFPDLLILNTLYNAHNNAY